jgi:hypothetical protein
MGRSCGTRERSRAGRVHKRIRAPFQVGKHAYGVCLFLPGYEIWLIPHRRRVSKLQLGWLAPEPALALALVVACLLQLGVRLVATPSFPIRELSRCRPVLPLRIASSGLVEHACSSSLGSSSSSSSLARARTGARVVVRTMAMITGMGRVGTGTDKWQPALAPSPNLCRYLNLRPAASCTNSQSSLLHLLPQLRASLCTHSRVENASAESRRQHEWLRTG